MHNNTLPRPIPLMVILSLYVSVTVLFGVVFQLTGLGFMIAGDSAADFKTLIHFRATDPVTTGVLITKSKSGDKYTKKNGNRWYPMYKFQYSYAVGLTSYQGLSHAKENDMTSGEIIEVAFVPGKPEMSRIVGMTAGPFVGSGVYMALAGVAIAVFGSTWGFIGFRKTRRNIALVRNGLLTTGIVTGRIATIMSFNHKRVYKIHFQFNHEDGRTCTGWIKTLAVEQLGEEQDERVLYDPAKPTNATLVDALPLKLREIVPA